MMKDEKGFGGETKTYYTHEQNTCVRVRGNRQSRSSIYIYIHIYKRVHRNYKYSDTCSL